MVSSRELLNRLLDENKLSYCQNCGSCTASCPMASAIPETYNPRIMLQRVTLDLDGLVAGDDLWLCAWCYRCTERCPQGIQPTEVFLLTRNFAAERGFIPENPKTIMREIMRSGRSVAVFEDFDEWRQEHGLPPIGSTISEKALEEQRKIAGEEFLRRILG
jgi:heterodisulfide reductase subunit C